MISPTRLSVRRLSINPIADRTIAYGKMMYKVSKFKGTVGIEKRGNPPATGARSPTEGTGISKYIITKLTISIAAKGPGRSRVTFGVSHIKTIVMQTIKTEVLNNIPLIHSSLPSAVSY